ncbi:rhodanese-like domain-containing protein [Roseobacter denitrificans]|uniref:Conserved domain protein n=1 Tax=Roseobacter denitrificans (strain ATCC 33942 / OCh 114) TaxID=375451 RepID=Q169Q2_ROSDO|nr:rhodanese-like domain-containing protein [Roseobacter denitrificans]ABG31291.1 conserved domain protein [Roseobacter denitrificans OCh 114]AVL54335.1 rhodanese-like domain-containing protein [Roseobacter denitrificans]SFF99087.1 Rhodanese-related sulfurtransferase [Roseobacter denitrificans OCh 114]
MGQLDPIEQSQKSPLRMSRRGLLVLAVAGVATGGAVAAQWFNILAENGEAALSAPDVHQAALSGEVVLVDIRRPEEWAHTGIGQGAVPIDMRRPDFVDALLAATQGDKARPVALICARGVRSRHMSEQLAAAGFTRIIDVPEGMLGSGAGPGWLKRGLPVVVAQ